MTDTVELIRAVSYGLYLLLALVAVRLWLRNRRARGAGWVAAAFAVGGAVVAVSMLTGDELGVGRPAMVTKAMVVLLLLLPVFLHRFVVAMESHTRRAVVLLEVAAGAVAAWTLALPRFPGPEEQPSGTLLAYTVAFLAFWAAINIRTALVLLRASRGQPGVVRRRLQRLAAGAIGLAMAILLPAMAVDSAALGAAGALAGLLSGVLFLLGFAPPSALRTRWRQPEEEALHEAIRELMRATTREAVAGILLPCMTALIGARGSALVANDEVIGRDGKVPEDPFAPADDVLEVPVAGHQRVLLWTSPWSPMLGEDERRLVARLAVLADLALDRSELFEAEQAARDEAERANREVESFVATITHDLRNPLTTIGGMADLLLGPLHGELGERARQFVERIRGNAEYMGRLVEDILALAEVGQSPTRSEPVDLDQVVRTVGAEVEVRQPEATVEVHDLPTILGDPVRLRRLVENVMANALKHGGREDIRIDASAVRHGDWLELRFLDDGRGIPVGESERVFGLFERIEGRGGGTGLGLAICRKLVEQEGGTMWFATSRAGADLRMRFPWRLVVPTDGQQRPDDADGDADGRRVAGDDVASLAGRASVDTTA